MKRLSERASQIHHEILDGPTGRIIDTTRPPSERSRENPREALAIKFVKAAVGNDDVLEMMASQEWNLVMDYKIESHRAGLVAAPLMLMKRIIRRFTRLYTDFIVTRQNRINTYLVNLCTQLVRELAQIQIEHEREVARLQGLSQSQDARISSSVAAINARFDNDEARLDLLRSELEVLAQAAEEARAPIARAHEHFDDDMSEGLAEEFAASREIADAFESPADEVVGFDSAYESAKVPETKAEIPESPKDDMEAQTPSNSPDDNDKPAEDNREL